MKFSKEGIEDITLQERQDRENWQQSWDTVEDGNAWIGLNNKRKLEGLLQKRQAAWEFSYKNTLVLQSQCAVYSKSVKRARIRLSKYTELVCQFKPLLLMQVSNFFCLI